MPPDLTLLRERKTVRDTISATQALRESEESLRKIVARSDRYPNARYGASEERRTHARCSKLSQRLAEIERSKVMKSAKALQLVKERFDKGQLLTRASKIRRLVGLPAKRGVHAEPDIEHVAVIAPGWVGPVQKIRDVQTAKRVVEWLNDHDAVWRDGGMLKADGRCAIPRSLPTNISSFEERALLQNLPAWQAARLTLLACIMAAKRKVSTTDFSSHLKQLGICRKYHDTLQRLYLK